MRRRLARSTPRDRGAAAVEFALLLPMLLLLIFGIIDFGRALNAQITLTQAAREGARLASVDSPVTGQPYSATTITNATIAAAGGLSGVTVPSPSICPVNAGLGVNATITVNYKFTFLTPLGSISRMFGSTIIPTSMTLTATGVMPCET